MIINPAGAAGVTDEFRDKIAQIVHIAAHEDSYRCDIQSDEWKAKIYRVGKIIRIDLEAKPHA